MFIILYYYIIIIYYLIIIIGFILFYLYFTSTEIQIQTVDQIMALSLGGLLSQIGGQLGKTNGSKVISESEKFRRPFHRGVHCSGLYLGASILSVVQLLVFLLSCPCRMPAGNSTEMSPKEFVLDTIV